jgi:predicted solute-binding protein
MGSGQRTSPRKGIHFDLSIFAARKIRNLNFLLKAKNESEFEIALTQSLNSSRKLRNYLITQKEADPVEKITSAQVFGFRHKPDLTIGNDGTAIKLKVVKGGSGIREALGQALCYRTYYGFVILVLIDQTRNKTLVEKAMDRNSPGHKLLRSMCDEFNVFTVVGPLGQRKNIAFIPK